MITISVISHAQDPLYLAEYGLEKDSKMAHWGPSIRDSYILHYVIKGSGFFNGRRVSMGQGFSINKNSLHEYHSSTDDPWEYFWLIFNGDDEYIHRCFKNANIDLNDAIYDIPFFSQLLQLIEKMIFNTPSITTSTNALSHFYSLISLHESSIPHAARASASETHVQNALLFIRNNYHRNIRITDIANYLYVDDRYLYNLFIKKFNIPPKTYLNNLRLSRACNLLCSTTLSITNIANSVGYDDVLSFSSFFRRNIGVSPSKYRAENSGDKLRNLQTTKE